ncbi:copper resistance protein B [Cupriavidus metallidurans]|nr:copper resistance protein B [Cupriavidus metallidurans]
MYKYTRIAVAALLTAGMSAAWAQHSHSPNSSNNDGAPANEATPDSRPQKATAPTAKKQGSTPSAGQGSMQGMDHSKMQGMEQGSMQGMDHSKMQGMDQGSMQGMDHSKMQGMDQGSMQGMDHSKMQGMDQGSMQGMDHSKMQGMDQGSMQGMDHSNMQGMDHGAMQMQGGSAPPDARDPDAYSDGAKLGVGQYAIGPSRSLHMADEHIFTSVLVDRLEWTKGNESNAASYEAQAWIGNAFNKFVIKAEGEVEKGKVPEARTELLWGHAIATYWDTQLGVRNDAGYGRPARNWLAFGVQGLAPYWFEVEATGYVGTEGRTALRLSGEYDLLLTQRLILQPRLEASLYGKNDPEIGIGSGLSSGAVGVRLRYEFSRQFAPYIGIERSQSFGNTANMVRASGGRSGETRFVAGIRMWF